MSLSCWVAAGSRVPLCGGKCCHVDVNIFPVAFLRVTGAPSWPLGLVGCGSQQPVPWQPGPGLELTAACARDGGGSRKDFLLLSGDIQASEAVYLAQLMCSEIFIINHHFS